jgi:hypothetical protein
MTRSHALPHYPNAMLHWRQLGWERRLLRFLELSGMGRTVEGGFDVEETHAARIDEWIVWEAEEEWARRGG